jgi:AAHS family 4-hydroxybenzoate transporter-like MFS transporter
LVGGLMLARGFSTPLIFVLAGLPVVISALTIHNMWRRTARAPVAEAVGH